MFGNEMIVAPVVPGRQDQQVWRRRKSGCRKASGSRGRPEALHGPGDSERSFSIDQIPVYLRPERSCRCSRPCCYTGEKPVDPLIVNVWPLGGASSSYSVYEDSGVSVEYQRGVFARHAD